MPSLAKNVKYSFMDQLKTRIGIGNYIGRNEDESQFLLAFKKSELTEEFLKEKDVPGIIINLWVDIEDVYEKTNEEAAPLPKRVVPSKIKRRKKNDVHSGNAKNK